MAKPIRRRAIDRLRERAREAITPPGGYLFAQIADDVAERRAELGLSQRELAQMTGTTQSAIARLERGGRPPRIDTLLRIAHALDCELVVELQPRRGQEGLSSGDAPRARPASRARPRRGLRRR